MPDPELPQSSFWENFALGVFFAYVVAVTVGWLWLVSQSVK